MRYGNFTIRWTSKKKSKTTTSITEAEINGVTLGPVDLLQVNDILKYVANP